MTTSLPLRLAPVGDAGQLGRSGIRWLRGDGEPCQAGDVVGVCNVGVRGAPGERAFLGERDDLRIALVLARSGILRHGQRISRGGWMDQMHQQFRWQAGQVVGQLEVEDDDGEEAGAALRLLGLAGRRVNDLAEDRSGLLSGWHDRKRAWHLAEAAPAGSVVGLGICELGPVLKGLDGAFLEMLGAVPGSVHVADVSDAPLVHSARVLIEQIERTDDDRAALAQDFAGMMAACLAGDAAGDCIFAGTLVKALSRVAANEGAEVLTHAGIAAIGPPHALVLSINGEGPVRYRHRTLGYTLNCYDYRFRQLSRAAMDWIKASFVPEPHTVDDARRDLLDLAGRVRRSDPGRRILVLNSVSTLMRDDTLSYDIHDAPLAQTLRGVRAREMNAMLHDVAGESGVAVVDSDALAAEFGVGRSVPDGIHQGAELQAALRGEILRVLAAEGVPGFAPPKPVPPPDAAGLRLSRMPEPCRQDRPALREGLRPEGR